MAGFDHLSTSTSPSWRVAKERRVTSRTWRVGIGFWKHNWHRTKTNVFGLKNHSRTQFYDVTCVYPDIWSIYNILTCLYIHICIYTYVYGCTWLNMYMYVECTSYAQSVSKGLLRNWFCPFNGNFWSKIRCNCWVFHIPRKQTEFNQLISQIYIYC